MKGLAEMLWLSVLDRSRLGCDDTLAPLCADLIVVSIALSQIRSSWLKGLLGFGLN